MREGSEATERNRQFVDRYSLVHAAVGAMFEVSKISAPVAIGSHIGFELVEDEVKRHTDHLWPDSRPDSWANHLGDVASFSLGFFGARALKGSDAGKWAVTGFIALAAGVWTWNLLHGHTWRARPK